MQTKCWLRLWKTPPNLVHLCALLQDPVKRIVNHELGLWYYLTMIDWIDIDEFLYNISWSIRNWWRIWPVEWREMQWTYRGKWWWWWECQSQRRSGSGHNPEQTQPGMPPLPLCIATLAYSNLHSHSKDHCKPNQQRRQLRKLSQYWWIQRIIF